MISKISSSHFFMSTISASDQQNLVVVFLITFFRNLTKSFIHFISEQWCHQQTSLIILKVLRFLISTLLMYLRQFILSRVVRLIQTNQKKSMQWLLNKNLTSSKMFCSIRINIFCLCWNMTKNFKNILIVLIYVFIFLWKMSRNKCQTHLTQMMKRKYLIHLNCECQECLIKWCQTY